MDAKRGTKRAAPDMLTDPMSVAVAALLDDLNASGFGEQPPLQPAVDSIDDFMERRFPKAQ